jgi:ApaG protein
MMIGARAGKEDGGEGKGNRGIMCHYCSLPRPHAVRPSWRAGKPVKPYDLSVTVDPHFVPEQSDPGEQQFVFAYTVRITNTGQHPAQVISRHWIIVDGNERVQEVRGLGVVGQQPLLAPGETFEYTSGCPLPTPVGTMRGTYHCVGENGIPFEVAIPEFLLAMPRTLH